MAKDKSDKLTAAKKPEPVQIERWVSIAYLNYTPGRDFDGDWPVQFDDVISIGRVPTFTDPYNAIGKLSEAGQLFVRNQPFCIMAEYDVPIYEPLDERRFQATVLPQMQIRNNLSWANLAVWLSQRSHFSYRVILNLRTQSDGTLTAMEAEEVLPIYSMAPYLKELAAGHFTLARDIYRQCVAAPEVSSISLAIAAQFRALSENAFQIRYLLHWIVLEALFGPPGAGETTFKLTQRLGFFLAIGDRTMAEEYVNQATQNYDTRSKIVHGKHVDAVKNYEKLERHLATTEMMVHQALKKILGDIDIAKKFHTDKNRDEYLKRLVYL